MGKWGTISRSHGGAGPTTAPVTHENSNKSSPHRQRQPSTRRPRTARSTARPAAPRAAPRAATVHIVPRDRVGTDVTNNGVVAAAAHLTVTVTVTVTVRGVSRVRPVRASSRRLDTARSRDAFTRDVLCAPRRRLRPRGGTRSAMMRWGTSSRPLDAWGRETALHELRSPRRQLRLTCAPSYGTGAGASQGVSLASKRTAGRRRRDVATPTGVTAIQPGRVRRKSIATRRCT
jgi:hypothetical protein